MESADSAQTVAKALKAENIRANTLYSRDSLDYHVYAHWIPIMEQRTWTPDGGRGDGQNVILPIITRCVRAVSICWGGRCTSM
ncbi:MAG: hypothetical protein R2932_43495 [Caldilineaceae bacterium]